VNTGVSAKLYLLYMWWRCVRNLQSPSFHSFHDAGILCYRTHGFHVISDRVVISFPLFSQIAQSIHIDASKESASESTIVLIGLAIISGPVQKSVWEPDDYSFWHITSESIFYAPLISFFLPFTLCTSEIKSGDLNRLDRIRSTGLNLI
jgi:hypothetical protein